MREPGTPRLLRAINDRAVLDLLLDAGPAVAPGPGRAHRAVQADRCRRSSRGSRASGWCAPSGSSAGPPGPNAQLYEIDPRRGVRRGPRRHPAPDPRRRRRHHRPDPRRVRAADTRPSRRATPSPASSRPSTAPAARPASTARALHRCDRHAGRVRPGHPAAPLRAAPARLARPQLLDRARRRARHPLEVDNDVNLAAVAELQPRRRTGQRQLRAALGRGGHRRGGRDRRPAAPRLHRRRRRGRLPAAARDPARPQRRRQQRRRLPGARRRQGGAGAGPRARPPRRARPRTPSGRRCGHRAPATRS